MSGNPTPARKKRVEVPEATAAPRTWEHFDECTSTGIVRSLPPGQLGRVLAVCSRSRLVDPRALQKSQELLARIYGYSGLHELQCELSKPGPPGLFDEDWQAQWFKRDLPKHLDPTLHAERSNRLLELVAAAKGIGDLKHLGKRGWDAREIGLFNSPSLHRHAFVRIRAKHEALDGTGPHNAPSIEAYATLDVREDGEAIATFTALGQAVHDAAQSLVPDPAANESQWKQSREKLFDLVDLHPHNPWPFAILLSTFAESWGQGEEDAFARENAVLLLPAVKRAMGLFEQLYRREAGVRPADPKLLSSFNYEWGSDSFSYPALLFWGGAVAANAGELRLAQRWLRRLRRANRQDNFGARFALARLREELHA